MAAGTLPGRISGAAVDRALGWQPERSAPALRRLAAVGLLLPAPRRRVRVRRARPAPGRRRPAPPRAASRLRPPSRRRRVDAGQRCGPAPGATGAAGPAGRHGHHRCPAPRRHRPAGALPAGRRGPAPVELLAGNDPRKGHRPPGSTRPPAGTRRPGVGPGGPLAGGAGKRREACRAGLHGTAVDGRPVRVPSRRGRRGHRGPCRRTAATPAGRFTRRSGGDGRRAARWAATPAGPAPGRLTDRRAPAGRGGGVPPCVGARSVPQPAGAACLRRSARGWRVGAHGAGPPRRRRGRRRAGRGRPRPTPDRSRRTRRGPAGSGCGTGSRSGGRPGRARRRAARSAAASARRRGSATGTADSSAAVYGSAGRRQTAPAGPSRRCGPGTSPRSGRSCARTADRSCAMNR